MLLEQSFDPLNQLLSLESPIPLPRFGEAEHEIGGIRLLGSVERGFDLTADAT